MCNPQRCSFVLNYTNNGAHLTEKLHFWCRICFSAPNPDRDVPKLGQKSVFLSGIATNVEIFFDFCNKFPSHQRMSLPLSFLCSIRSSRSCPQSRYKSEDRMVIFINTKWRHSAKLIWPTFEIWWISVFSYPYLGKLRADRPQFFLRRLVRYAFFEYFADFSVIHDKSFAKGVSDHNAIDGWFCCVISIRFLAV